MAGFEFKKVENEIKEFWKKNKTYDKIKQRNEEGPKFFFMDGPPYTSGKIHLGQAWNKSLKDSVLRFRRMKGDNVFDRACYDMHGLPTAQKVMKLHGLQYNEDIDKFGMDKFVKECKKWSVEKAEAMTDDFQNMGVWLDFSNPLYPIDNNFIEGCWGLIKKAHEDGRLYQGKRPLYWSASTETALAKHELVYETIKDKSIFVKFKLKDSDEYLVIWTTTPWTIPFNLAVMVHPDFDYIKADVDGEKWIVAKELAHQLIEVYLEKELIICEEFKGKDLEGKEYVHPFENKLDVYKELKSKHAKVHTVLLTNQYVDLSAGTGLVHCAPGCGPEDYEVGHQNGIPPFNEVNEQGKFSESMGFMKGKAAKLDDRWFIEELGDAVAYSRNYSHDYPHDERTKQPVIFRATKQWFFKMEDLKEQMIAQNQDVRWEPQNGKNRFNSWLENLRDNSITKQNVWGTPIPIWKSDKSDYFEVIGSMDELKEKAGSVPDDLHRPFIDEVTWTAPDGGTMRRIPDILDVWDGGTMRRIPDILDVWVDAGMLPFNVVDYHKDPTLFNDLFPGDYIVEGTDQIRGWFNILLVCATLMDKEMPFKNVYMHGMITDVDGVKMSKSLGNILDPNELFNRAGIDASRVYLSATPPGPDKKFSWKELDLVHRDFNVIWNVHNFLIEMCELNSIDLTKEIDLQLGKEEKYMLSRLHSTIKEVTEKFETYKVNETAKPALELLLDLSRKYIKYVREKAATGSDEEKQTIAYVIHKVLFEGLKLLAPNCPFITEKIYSNIKHLSGSSEVSVHEFDWPVYDEKQIDTHLENGLEVAENVIQSLLALRKKTNRSVKWPYMDAYVQLDDYAQKDDVNSAVEIIKSQTNIKNIEVIEKFENLSVKVEPNMKNIGPKFGKDSKYIFTKLLETERSSIVEAIESSGKFILSLDNDYELERTDFKWEYEVKEPFVKNDFAGGQVYLDKTVNEELEIEGFAREIVRKVQAMRKDQGFVKSDKIDLFIETDIKGVESIIESSKEKLGFKSLSFEANDGLELEIKDKVIKIKIL